MFDAEKSLLVSYTPTFAKEPKERMRTHMLTVNYIESLMNIKAECIKNTSETNNAFVYELQIPVTVRTCPG